MHWCVVDRPTRQNQL